MFVQLTTLEGNAFWINFDLVDCFNPNAKEGTNVHIGEYAWTVRESPEHIGALVEAKRLPQPRPSELEAAAERLIDCVVRKYGITSPVQFSCPHIRNLAEVVGYFRRGT